MATPNVREMVDMRDQYRRKVDLAGGAVDRLKTVPAATPDFEIWARECTRLLEEARELHTKILERVAATRYPR